MYSVVQFAESEGGTVAVVINKWITPKKREIYWPPVKEAKAFDKLLQRCSSPNEQWKLYEIDRVFYQTDELDKAKKKLKLVEDTSDIQTEEENYISKPPKRKTKKTSRYISSSDDNDDEKGCEFPRPPPLKKHLSNYINLEPSSTSTIYSDLVLNHNSQMNKPDAQEKASNSHHDQPSGSQSMTLDEIVASSASNNCDCQGQVVSLLAKIKAQNDVILAILKDRAGNTNALKPEFKFPLETFQDLETVEQLLTNTENCANLTSYLKSLGGHDLKNKVSRVMKYTLSDSLASKFNFYGKRSEKKPFSELRLREFIVESLKSSSPRITEKDIEDDIKVWLKHAPERAKKRLSKENNNVIL